MSKPKVIVTRKWPESVEAKLKELYDVQLNENDVAMTPDELKAALGNCDAFCPTVTDPINADVLGTENISAKIIGSYGVGFNHIDLDAAKARGLTVTNTPEVLTDCTADIAMGLLLAAARRITEGERHLRAGEWTGWRPTHMMATKVTGKTLGCIGFGRIAQAMAQRAHFGFSMDIIFSDPYPPPQEVIDKFGAKQMSVEELADGHEYVWKKVYRWSSMTRRLWQARNFQPLAFTVNLGYRFYAHNLHRFYTCDWPIDAMQRRPEPANAAPGGIAVRVESKNRAPCG